MSRSRSSRYLRARSIRLLAPAIAAVVVATALVVIQPAAASAEPDVVTVNPTEHNNLMRSPGIGFQDFLGYLPSSGALAACTHDQTVDAVGLKGGSIYLRFLWKTFEPAEGQYNWPLFDRLFECAEERNQTVDLRVMTSWPDEGDKDCWNDPSEDDDIPHGIPCWLVRKGVSELEHDGAGSTDPNYLPDWEDPTIRFHHAQLLNALGARYGDHPRLNSVDIGSVGFWGEWHTYPNDNVLMPSKARQKEIIDLYASAFPNTMLIALAEIFKNQDRGDTEISDHLYNNYAGRFGWRGDSWAQRGHHEYDYDPINTNNPDLWKTGPVLMEVSDTMDRWYLRFGVAGYDGVLPVATSIDDALRWHTSLAHNKGDTIPPEFVDNANANTPDLRSMAKSMGARFVLDRLTYTDEITAGASTQITSTWHNRGVAPLYRDFRVSYRLRNASGSTAIRTGTTLKGLLPTGDTPWTKATTVNIPASVADGNYTLDVGIAYITDIDLKMPIAITNANDNDWYEIGPIVVGDGGNGGNGGEPGGETQITGIVASVPVNGQDAANIVDGNGATAWDNNNVTADGNFTLDLGQTSAVSRIRYQDDYDRKLSITVDGVEVFNGWTSGAGEDTFADIEVAPPVSGRFVRFEQLATGWLVPEEVEVYQAGAAGPAFACASDGGVLSWTDAGALKYWVYKSTNGGASFSWLGRTAGSPAAATTFTDANASVGAKYQVHYEGIPRVECSITSEPINFDCASDGGVLSWTDAGALKYWVYKSTNGGASFSWLGRTAGSPAAATTFTDANASVGAKYQVHYEGIPRVECSTTSEPSNGGGFSCASDGGVLSWTDAGALKYWVYKSTNGGASFSWLGRTAGSPAATTFTDSNPSANAVYQVHYQGIPRVVCDEGLEAAVD